MVRNGERCVWIIEEKLSRKGPEKIQLGNGEEYKELKEKGREIRDTGSFYLGSKLYLTQRLRE